jgi:NACalpha-BTF3-like transcription factor
VTHLCVSAVQAIKALRDNDKDIVNAIMQLTM